MMPAVLSGLRDWRCYRGSDKARHAGAQNPPPTPESAWQAMTAKA